MVKKKDRAGRKTSRQADRRVKEAFGAQSESSGKPFGGRRIKPGHQSSDRGPSRVIADKYKRSSHGKRKKDR